MINKLLRPGQIKLVNHADVTEALMILLAPSIVE